MIVPVRWRGAAGFDRDVAGLRAVPGVPGASPIGIVAARAPGDVDAAIGLCRERGRQLTIRSGGHSLSGTHLREGALVVDLRSLQEISVDLESGLTSIGPGVSSLATAVAMDRAGVEFPIGHSPHVGMGGYLLAGGNGWGSGLLGAAAHRVVAAIVVTGDGRRQRVTEQSDPEMFWALRGAGPAFPGVVTGFEVRAERGASTIHRYLGTLPGGCAARLGALLDVLEPTPSALELTVFVRPDGADGEIVVSATTFTDGTVDGVESVMGALSGLDVPWREQVRLGPMPTRSALLASLPDHSGDAQWSHHVWSDLSWEGLLRRVPMDRPGPGARCSVLISRAPPTVQDGSALYSPRSWLGVSAYAQWTPGRPAADGIAWTRQMLDDLGGSRPRRYVAEADLTGDPRWIEQCYPAGAMERLERLRERVDPGRVVASVLDRLAE